MGVTGLQSFIVDHLGLLRQHQLRNTRVVIDGFALAFFLSFRHKINIQLGGDYDKYALGIREFFSLLLECNVTPFVLFDGASDVSDRKLSTYKLRAKKRLTDIRNFNRKKGGNVYLGPLFTKQAMTGILDEMGIAYSVTVFEADEEIAALANYWLCPVISNDSDFMVFGLTGGLILLDKMTLRLRKTTGSTSYLNVKIFRQEFLLHRFPDIDDGSIKLLATLLGNDYVGGQQFKRFVTFVVSTYSHGRGSSKIHTITALLEWMSSKGSTDSAIEEILERSPEADRQHKKGIIQHSMQSYVVKQPNFTCYNSMFPSCRETRVLPHVSTYSGNNVPSWIIALVTYGAFPTTALEVMVHHRVLHSQLMDELTCPSAFQCSMSLRQIMYGIMFTVDQRPSQNLYPISQVQKELAGTPKRNYSPQCSHSGNPNTPKAEKFGSKIVLHSLYSASAYLDEYHDQDHRQEEERGNASPGFGEDSTGKDTPEDQESDSSGSDLALLTAEVEPLNNETHGPDIDRTGYVEEWDRDGSLYKPVKVQPVFYIKDGTPVPDLISVPSMSQEQRLKTLCRILDINLGHVKVLSPKIQLMFMAVVVWVQRCKHTLSLDKVIAAIAWFTQLYAKEIVSNKLNGSKKAAYVKTMDLIDKLSKPVSRQNAAYLTLTHSFAQLQTCILAVSQMNQVLLSPLPRMLPYAVLNGSFLHNMTLHLSSKKDGRNYVADLLSGYSRTARDTFLHVYDRIMNFYW